MMQTVSRDEAREIVESGDNVTVVEVLEPNDFRRFHLPGAVNVPLGDGFEQRIRDTVPDKGKPILVYCQDAECRASPQAAQRLDELGYEEVYDYEAGKVDWKEAGLPVES